MATLRSSEADAVRKIEGVVDLQPDVLQFALTDAGPDQIGAKDLWTGDAGTFTRTCVAQVVAVEKTKIRCPNPADGSLSEPVGN